MTATATTHPSGARAPDGARGPEEGHDRRLGDELAAWLTGPRRTLGSLVHAFGERSFAVILVVLLAVPALPVPTAGITHLFEIVAALVGLQIIAGRSEVWLPERWRALELGGPRAQKFVGALTRVIRWLERFSRPRLRSLLDSRGAEIAFGVIAIALTVATFVAPPFSGLDTLPALGVVVLALGMLLSDGLVVAGGLVIGAAGVALELALGAAALHSISAIL